MASGRSPKFHEHHGPDGRRGGPTVARRVADTGLPAATGISHVTLGGVFAVINSGVAGLEAAGVVNSTAAPQTSRTGAGGAGQPAVDRTCGDHGCPISPATPAPAPRDLSTSVGDWLEVTVRKGNREFLLVESRTGPPVSSVGLPHQIPTRSPRKPPSLTRGDDRLSVAEASPLPTQTRHPETMLAT